jgi:hypothetical protein
VVRIAVAVILLAAIAGGSARAACLAGHPVGARGDTLAVGYALAPPLVTAVSTDRAPHGLAIDQLLQIAAREGWRLTWIELTADALRTRLAACELDVGVVGIAASAELVASGSAAAPALELSQPYFSSVTTAVVHGDDEDRAAAPGHHSRAGRAARVVLHGGVGAAVALGLLAFASWGLNLLGRVRARHWRRLDATVGGPWAGLAWLGRSATGRALIALWGIAGAALGVTGALGGEEVVGRGDPSLAALVRRAAHGELLIGERYPDRVAVTCAVDDAACFRGFADGTLSAIAGARERLCAGAEQLSIDDAVVRDDLAIPEHYAYLLPVGSPLRARLDLALLRQLERAPSAAPGVRCPDGGR